MRCVSRIEVPDEWVNAVLICDTSGLLAAVDEDDPRHREVVTAVQDMPGPYVISSLVLAELDYLLRRRAGPDKERIAL